MVEIIVGDRESFESALRRFKKKCQYSGLINEMKKRQHYEAPSLRRKKKDLVAARKLKRRLSSDQ